MVIHPTPNHLEALPHSSFENVDPFPLTMKTTLIPMTDFIVYPQKKKLSPPKN
jgi:hypothetical protein